LTFSFEIADLLHTSYVRSWTCGLIGLPRFIHWGKIKTKRSFRTTKFWFDQETDRMCCCRSLQYFTGT